MHEFFEVYRLHYSAVFRFALFLTGDRSLAEDLTADTFVRAWIARDRIRDLTVRSYLLTITRNLRRDQLRGRRPHYVELDEGLVDSRPGVDVRVEHESTLRSVRARLKRVSRGDRRALLLYVVREMSYAEISRALGISVGAVKSRVARAREALARTDQIARNGVSQS